MARCKICRSDYKKLSIKHKVCSADCAIIFNQQEKERKAAKETRKKKIDTRTRAEWVKLAQAAFNAFIRQRDILCHKVCICCGEPLPDQKIGGGFDCGHYRSVGSAPHLRFNENNAHGQRKHCNQYRSGRAVDYRIGLIKRIGLEAVEALEADQTVKKWAIEELKEICQLYRAKLKELKSKEVANVANADKSHSNVTF